MFKSLLGWAGTFAKALVGGAGTFAASFDWSVVQTAAAQVDWSSAIQTLVTKGWEPALLGIVSGLIVYHVPNLTPAPKVTTEVVKQNFNAK